MSSGVGFWDTTGAMHERHRYHEYSNRVWGKGVVEKEESGWKGCISLSKTEDNMEGQEGTDAVGEKKKDKGKGRDVEDVLEDNDRLIEELQCWQYLRLRRGSETWIPDREKLVGMSILREGNQVLT